jgi:hypothetical protein
MPRVNTTSIGLLARVDQRRIVPGCGNLSGLVGHPGSRREPRRNAIVEFLGFQNLEQLATGCGPGGAAVPDGEQQSGEVARGGRVVESPLVRLPVFHPAEHRHRIRTQPVDRSGDPLGIEPFHQQIGGEVARADDHPGGKLAESPARSDRGIHRGIAVGFRVQLVGRAVDDRGEPVPNDQRVGPAQFPRIDLPAELDEHRDFHGARRMETEIGLELESEPRSGVPCHHRDGGPTVLRDPLPDRLLQVFALGRNRGDAKNGQRNQSRQWDA